MRHSLVCLSTCQSLPPFLHPILPKDPLEPCEVDGTWGRGPSPELITVLFFHPPSGCVHLLGLCNDTHWVAYSDRNVVCQGGRGQSPKSRCRQAGPRSLPRLQGTVCLCQLLAGPGVPPVCPHGASFPMCLAQTPLCLSFIDTGIAFSPQSWVLSSP